MVYELQLETITNTWTILRAIIVHLGRSALMNALTVTETSFGPVHEGERSRLSVVLSVGISRLLFLKVLSPGQ